MSPLAADGFDPELLPLAEFSDCAAAVLAADSKRILSYGTGAGYTPLRELIAAWFAVEPSRVVLTNGSLHGLGLLARALGGERPTVAEYPIYDRAERALLQAGAVLTSVQIEPQGFRLDELRQMLVEFRRPELLYTIPTFHNPTGYTMTAATRVRLVDLVRRQNLLEAEHQLVLVEDDAYGLTRFEGERAPTLFDVSAGSTVYSSSFSTTISPGLRVGWLVLPDRLAARIVEAATAAYISPVLLGQATVFEFLRRGALEAHLERLRDGLRLRRDALLGALAEHFPDGSWVVPEGGFHLWVELPLGNDSRGFIEAAGLAAARPGTAFAWTANAFRVSFAALAPDQLVAGVERLAAARAAQRTTTK